MSRAGGYRSSAGDLGVFDDDVRSSRGGGGGGGGGGGRWDRERFERMAGGRREPPSREPPSREPPSRERDSFHFEEHDRGPGRNRLDIQIDERRGPAPTRVAEKERFVEEDRFERFERSARRRPEFLDEPTPAEIANRALAPYRRKSIIERDVFEAPARRPARPQYIRRQSSLDTFDRRPYPRYGDQEREEWRPPVNVPIPLPIRERERPSRPRYQEEEFEEIRYREPSPQESEYREVEVRREKSKHKRSKSRKAQSVRSSSSSFEEVEAPSVREPPGRKGKTRMPKRLAKKEVIVDLGYPFEEEDDFIIIRRALEKEQIDEIIKVSETFEESGGNEKMTYVYEDTKTKAIEPPPPPPPPETIYIPPPPPSIHYAPPPPQSVYAPPPPESHYAKSVRSASPPRHEHFEERFEESNHISGPLTVLAPRGERDIKAEIRRLEDERRMLKYERESDRLVDYEVIERREPPREVVRIEKDRKARKPNPKLVAAMMATLS